MQQEREELQAQIAALQAENQSVKQQNHQLKEQNNQLQQQNQQLEEENQQLKSENQELQEPSQQLEEQNHQLQERNQELIQQLKNIAMLDYEALRSHTLKSMTVGKGSAASTSPQYKFASRATDKLIEDIRTAISDIAPSTPTSILAENTPDSLV